MLAIINRAAGGGRCGREADAALGRLGLDVERAPTDGPGHAREIAREAYARGVRRFLAVGGDGTAHEVLNGLFPCEERVTLGFLPLGTGNSFLRDFSSEGLPHAIDCIRAGRSRGCDVMRLEHSGGVVHSINLICLGFPADVAAVTNRRFKRFGALGYLLGVVACLARLPRRTFPLVADGAREAERCLFLGFNNSRFTGGGMQIAPLAQTDDGLIEYLHFGPIGRLALLWNLKRLFDGSLVRLPWARRRGVREVRFESTTPCDLMIDGEVLRTVPRTLSLLPGALDVLA